MPGVKDKGTWVIRRGATLVGVMVFLISPSFAGEVRGRVVSTKGEGVAQAVVFVQELPAGLAPKSVARSAIMDQVHKQYVPHVLPIVVGTEVHFPNHDQIHHHVYSFSRNRSFEIPLYKDDTPPPVRFDKIGVVKVGCNIHDWMSGVILVIPTPYYATTDEAGGFVLQSLPAGTYSLACWHELGWAKAGDTVQKVLVDGNTPKVTFTLPLKPARPRLPVYGVRGYR
jgi:plastocyanin